MVPVRRSGRVRREPIWSVTSGRGQGCSAHRSRIAAAGTAGLPGAGPRPDGPVHPGLSANRTGRQPTSRTLTGSADRRATGPRLTTGAVTRARQIRAALAETGGLPVASGLTVPAARPDKTACDLTTAAAVPRPGRTGGGEARTRLVTLAATGSGRTGGASPAATMTGAGGRTAMVSTARRGRLLRRRPAPDPRSQRRGGSFRQPGRTPGARARQLPHSPVARRLAGCGPTSTDVRQGWLVPAIPVPGAPLTGVRCTVRGRTSRRRRRTARGHGGTTNLASGRMLPSGRHHPAGRRAPPPPSRRDGCCLRQPGGLSVRTRPGRPNQSCTRCLRRPSPSRPSPSRHRPNRPGLSRTGLSLHSRLTPRRRCPQQASGPNSERVFRWRISSGCARR